MPFRSLSQLTAITNNDRGRIRANRSRARGIPRRILRRAAVRTSGGIAFFLVPVFLAVDMACGTSEPFRGLPVEIWTQGIFPHIRIGAAATLARLVCRSWAAHLQLRSIFFSPALLRALPPSLAPRIKSVASQFCFSGDHRAEDPIESEDLFALFQLQNDFSVTSICQKTLRHRYFLLEDFVKNAPNLRRLAVSSIELPLLQSGISTLLSSCSTLEELDMEFLPCESGYILDFWPNFIGFCKELMAHKSLQKLSIALDCAMIVPVITAIAYNKSLRFLRLWGHPPRNDPLDIDLPVFSDACLSALDSARTLCQQLRTLIVRSAHIAPIARACAKSSSLSHIWFEVSDFHDTIPEALTALVAANGPLVSLKVVNGLLVANREDWQNLAPALQAHTSLTDLVLAENGLSLNNIHALVTSLVQNSTLTKLDVLRNPLFFDIDEPDYGGTSNLANLVRGSDVLPLRSLSADVVLESLSELCLAIAEQGDSCKLKALIIEQCSDDRDEIKIAAAENLSKFFKVNQSVEEFGISLVRLGPHLCVAFGALTENYTITTFQFSSTHVQLEDIAALTEALSANRSITSCKLDFTSVHDAGCKHLANLIRSKSTIRDLSLIECQIGDTGASELAAALSANTTLERLSLDRNDIGEEGLGAFASAIERGTSLEVFRCSSIAACARLRLVAGERGVDLESAI